MKKSDYEKMAADRTQGYCRVIGDFIYGNDGGVEEVAIAQPMGDTMENATANAAFFALAWNSHDKMLAALLAVLPILETSHGESPLTQMLEEAIMESQGKHTDEDRQ